MVSGFFCPVISGPKRAAECRLQALTARVIRFYPKKDKISASG
jgi:hypothetical protein